jgi:hypothetical protein
MRNWIWIILITSAGFSACRSDVNEPFQMTPAFYHWKTGWTPSDSLPATNYLGKEKLFVRMFDLDWSEGRQSIIPVAMAQLDHFDRPDAEIIPTIFITNRSFERLPEASIPDLARKTSEKIKKLIDEMQLQHAPREWQFDCDWTRSTRAAYFQFLQEIRALVPEPTQLSATIRLHQVKYPEQTGVPPVDRGMLMFYNMGQIRDPLTTNSILDLDIASRYYEQLDEYALPLDLALPLFSWGIVFREGKLVHLLNQLERERLTDTSRFQALNDIHFQVRRSTYLDSYYLYKDDLIRFEWVPLEQLYEAARQVRDQLKREDRTIAFYHLDNSVLKRYEDEELRELLRMLE